MYNLFRKFFFKIAYPHFSISPSLLQYLIGNIFLTSAPGRGVAAEEFCVFGDWGGSLNKPEKPERSGGFFANGAPLALLAKFVFRKNFSICETKCPCVPYYPYREIFLYWKKFPRILDFLSLLAILPIWEGFQKILQTKMKQKHPSCPISIMRRKIFWKIWNKTGVPCHYNITEGFQK